MFVAVIATEGAVSCCCDSLAPPSPAAPPWWWDPLSSLSGCLGLASITQLILADSCIVQLG